MPRTLQAVPETRGSADLQAGTALRGAEVSAISANPAMPHCDTQESITGAPLHKHAENYSALMKNLRVVSLFLTPLLLGSMTLAQAGSQPLPDAPQPQTSTPAQPEKTSDANAVASDDKTLISQAGRYPRLPRRPVRAPRGYAYGPTAPMPGLSPAGALIGFGIGAGLGAAGSQDSSASARVASALIVGAIGSLIGGAIGAFPHVGRRYPSDPDDDDDSDLRSDGRSHKERSASAKTAGQGQSNRAEATAQASLEAPPIP
jgi:hypothetical protein